jgi:hypothetical protein
MKFKELRKKLLAEGMSKQMPITKYAKTIGITPKDQQWILDNEADMIVFEPNQNKANSFLVLSYPVNDGDYYFAFLTGKSSDPQDKMRDMASKANAKMNKYLKDLVKKNAASMGDSNLSGFVWIEMMKQFDKLPRSLGAGDTMTREELAAAIEDAVGAPIIWEGTDTSNKPQIAEGILDKIMDKIRRAKGKFKKIKLGRKAKTNMESKENVNERKYTEKDILIQKAVGIALKMGGNMTGAYKKIESMKRGLGDNPIVKQALRLANESVDEKSKGKPLTPLQRKTVMKLYKDVAKGGPNAQKALAKLRVVLDVPVNESLEENVKAVMKKHKKHIDKWKRSNKPMPIQVEDELMRAAMDAGEIKTDDPDEFDNWLDRNV